MRIIDWSSDVCSSDLIGERRKLVGRCVEGDRQPPTGIDGAAQHLGDRLPAFLSGIPGFQYRVCLPSVLTQRHRRAALEDDYHRLAGGFERVQQRSEEHTSELQSLMRISYAVFCLKKKMKDTNITQHKNKHTQ